MGNSYKDAVRYLEQSLEAIECEFLYLISDMQPDAKKPARDLAPALNRLKVAQRCVGEAQQILSVDITQKRAADRSPAGSLLLRKMTV